eukprot:NODE_201_length_1214_cov_270.198283_g160_i0.p1 GENE.NODE_201_length_1214_cov_270.198283_g160_i0~~NODE_201_length_1214_cov_270.198283_g160_i0.p1  ORF type:complete len:391 (+),score=77.34 NODE_201_length_1214_cov_270.198283_g160_i0:24-1175(+)
MGDVTPEELLALFSEYGTVVEVSLKKGYAFIDYDTSQAATLACTLDGHVVGGKALAVRLNTDRNNVQHARPQAAPVYITPVVAPAVVRVAPPAVDKKSEFSVFVGGVAPDVSEEELRSIFGAYGHIVEVCLKKGYAFIDYDSVQSARAACAMDGFILGEKTLGVRLNIHSPRTQAPIQPAVHVITLPPRSAPPVVRPTPPTVGLSPRGGDRKSKCSVFVGSLAHNITEQDLMAAFGQYGSVTQVCLKHGYAFIDYTSAESAALACNMDGQEMGGRAIAVRLNTAANSGSGVKASPRAAPPTHPPPRSTSGVPPVFVGGLPEGVTEQDIIGVFAAYGHITGIRMKKTYCFIDYATREAAQAACCMDQSQWEGKTLGVRINEQDA